MLFGAEGTPVGELLAFQCENLTKSMAWHRKLVFHVRLLLEFAEANLALCQQPQVLFQTFLDRLSLGTIENGYDPSGLYWTPRPSGQVRQICANLTAFSSFVSRRSGGQEFNPRREANLHERVCRMIAKTFRQKHDFLKHLKSSSSAWREAAIVNLSFHKFRAAPRVEGNAKTRFPSDRFGDLILTGFATRPWAQEPWMRLNIRDVLITLLLHGGGLRVSEPFHMYVNDVTPDPLDSSKALVRIGHPTWGEISWREPSGRLVTTTRAEYLARKGLPQRELVAGPMRAGWKNPLLDGKFYLEVRWAHPDYSRLFLKLWEHYLGEYLSLPSPPTHPWAWVSFDPKNIGSPLKIQRYLDAHDRAVRRIALPLGRANGTNPHAHRHSYGYWLESLGLKREVIRRFMHHASLSSQDAYKQESDHDLHNALTAGIDRLRQCTPAVMGPVQQQQDSSLLANSLLQTARNGTGGYAPEWAAALERLTGVFGKFHP